MERRYSSVEKKMSKAEGNTKRLDKIEKKYGYDYVSAEKAGIGPDSTGHWPSRDTETGRILKGRKHPSIMKTRKIERVLGNKIKRIDGNLYSFPKKNNI